MSIADFSLPRDTKYASVPYAFTVTLKPKLYEHTIGEQYDRTYLEIAQRLKSLVSTVSIIAERTKNYNLHYHGIIIFDMKYKDNRQEFHDLFRKSTIFGFRNIRQIEDYQGWVEYISKELIDFRKKVGRCPIIIDDLEIFDKFRGIEGFINQDLVDEQ